MPAGTQFKATLKQFRPAEAADIIPIANMLRRFYKREGAIYKIPYDHESCIESVIRTIEHGVCVVGSQSCAGALLAPFEFNNKILAAQVFFWYFENKREFLVFDALMVACARAGASMVNAASLSPRHPAKKFYARRGLALTEAHHWGLNPEWACIIKEQG